MPRAKKGQTTKCKSSAVASRTSSTKSSFAAHVVSKKNTTTASAPNVASPMTTTTTARPEAAAAQIHLPAEIILMIAEQFVEPYKIEVRRMPKKEKKYRGQPLCYLEGPNLPQLPLVSKGFQAGIERGLLTRFTGHLDVGRNTHKEFEKLKHKMMKASKWPMWLDDLVTKLTVRMVTSPTLQGIHIPEFEYRHYYYLKVIELVFPGRNNSVQTAMAKANQWTRRVEQTNIHMWSYHYLNMNYLRITQLIGYHRTVEATIKVDMLKNPVELLETLDYLKR